MSIQKRKIKLIKPRLQLKLTMVFVGFSALALMLQFVLFTSALTEAALALPEDGPLLMERTSGLMVKIVMTSSLLFLPLIFMVGILTTFRFAGPVHRFEIYLNQLIRGERPGPCRIRSGDELHELCDLLNRATEPLRGGEADDQGDASNEADPESLVKAEADAPVEASSNDA